MKIWRVYRATHKETGMVYIGCSGQEFVTTRWDQHWSCCLAGNPHPFYMAMALVGPQGFIWEVLSEHDSRRAALREEDRLTRIAGRRAYNCPQNGNRIRAAFRTIQVPASYVKPPPAPPSARDKAITVMAASLFRWKEASAYLGLKTRKELRAYFQQPASQMRDLDGLYELLKA